jgi:hypothetical protein
MVTVNGRIRVFDKDGTNPGVLDVSDSTFWSSVRNGLDVTDPQVEYDRLSQRWIVAQINFDPTNPSFVNNRIMLAVSSGPEITSQSDFTYYFFTQNGPNPGATARFADYPQMGIDANAIYIGTNDFASNGSFAGTTAYVIRKSSVTAGGPIVVTAFRGLTNGIGVGPDSPQPAQNMDPNVGEGYIVGPDNASFGKLDIRRISNPGGTPSISGNLSVTVPSTTFPENVPAQGSPHKLDALDDRLFEAMIGRDESGTLSLWTAHNIEVDSSGVASASGSRDGARWYQLGNLSTTPTLLQSGTLFDPAGTNPRYFWIPSIAMNGQGHASLNSSTAGTGRFAEVASTAHLSGDSTGTTEPFDITQTSSSTYNVGDNPERWGDYSQTVVDPTDNMTFWTFQEYTYGTDDWGVQVIKLRPPPPASPTSATPNTVASGQSSVSVTVTGTSVNGSGFFDPGSDPGGPGYDNHIDATVSGGVVVNDVTYTDPTHVTLDLDTTGATAGSQDLTIINPDGQSSTGSNILVVDSDVIPPPPPTLLGTTPTSPASDNSPLINGGAEGGSTVSLFANGTCSGSPVATDSALTYTSPGIGVTVTPNTTTTFSAKATDLSNHVSACSSTLGLHGTIAYTEDSSAPQIAIDSGPSGATADRSPTFGFHATDAFPPGGVIGFACSIDTGTASFGPCSGSGTDTPAAPLADGSYTFQVRATDAVGNSSVATRAFSVKATPPETTITKGPKKTKKRRPKFKFAASEPGTTFRCQLDKGAFAPCKSPFVPPKLRFGKHVLKVEAVDSLGNVDPTPAVRKFKVLPS